MVRKADVSSMPRPLGSGKLTGMMPGSPCGRGCNVSLKAFIVADQLPGCVANGDDRDLLVVIAHFQENLVFPFHKPVVNFLRQRLGFRIVALEQ